MRAENIVDVSTVVNPWQALVVIVALIVVFGLPQLATLRNSRHAKTAANEARDAIQHEAAPNSGSSMKDSLNRIERTLGEVQETQTDQADRLAALERAAAEARRHPLFALFRH